MVTEMITIEFAPSEGAVLRLLGLVERRGFRIRAVRMPARLADEAGRLTLELEALNESRRVEVLEAQLRRLHGVRSVVAAGGKAVAAGAAAADAARQAHLELLAMNRGCCA